MFIATFQIIITDIFPPRKVQGRKFIYEVHVRRTLKLLLMFSEKLTHVPGVQDSERFQKVSLPREHSACMRMKLENRDMGRGRRIISIKTENNNKNREGEICRTLFQK